MKLHKLFSVFMVLVVVAFSVLSPNGVSAVQNTNQKSAGLNVIDELSVENDNFILTAEGESGAVYLKSKNTGEVWYSNPQNRASLDIKGIVKMTLNSQLIVSYLSDGKNEKQVNSYASCSQKKGITVKTSTEGIRIDYKFVSEKFTIPVLYSIDSEGMIAKVLTSEITEQENLITSISLLPYFGAGSFEEDGYFLVPDGCGAIINFNNGKTGNYQQEIYDTDGLMNSRTDKIVSQRVALPIFGIKKAEDSVLAIIEGGDTCCRLFSFVSNGANTFNYIYPQFTYRQSALIGMLSKTWYPVDIAFVSSKTMSDEDFQVKYIPLQKSGAGYSEMATRYRDYLIASNELVKSEGNADVPLYLDVYGSALVTKNFLGFPFTINRSLTSFKQLESALKDFLSEGIDDIKVQYRGISSSGLDNKKVSSTFSVASSIGGNKAYSEFLDFAEKNNIDFYPFEDFVFINKPSFMLIKPRNVAKDIQKKNGIYYEYDISNGMQLSSGAKKYVLKTSEISKITAKFIKSYDKFGGNKLAVSTLGNIIYSDFDDSICLANEARDNMRNIMSSFNKESVSLLLEYPNAYALPYAESIVALPTESSNYDLEDYTVPFYQMVIHGYIAYSTTPINRMADSRYGILKAIETGSSLLYAVCSEEFSTIRYDGYEELYCLKLDDWKNEIVESSNYVRNALKTVSGATITSHTRISEQLYKTSYSNGISIITNYGETPIDTEYGRVDAMDYLSVKEAVK